MRLGGWWTYVRVGAWASGGGVVIGLDFEGWEEGGETIFGYGATRVRWGHFEGKVKSCGNAKALDSFTFLLQKS